jgi:hypothetical protein
MVSGQQIMQTKEIPLGTGSVEANYNHQMLVNSLPIPQAVEQSQQPYLGMTHPVQYQSQWAMQTPNNFQDYSAVGMESGQ